jgi:putative hydrolase of the HAD superfamily
MKTKLIIFDAYGVTIKGGFPQTIDALSKVCKRKDKKHMFDVFYFKWFPKAIRRQIPQKEAWIQSVKELNLPLTWQEVRDLHYKQMSLNKELLPILKKLKKENNVLLLTANTRTQFVDTNKMFNMGQYFTKMMNTWELQMQKSEEKTYKHICKVFNVKPNEIIYIDDQERNLVAPKNLGIQTIFYKNFKQFKKEFDKLYN